MSNILTRYRTSRGFGVHSPLAYRFITGPLRDTAAAYYCFDKVTSRRARRLVRCVVFVGAGRITVAGDIHDDLSPAISALDTGKGPLALVVTSVSDLRGALATAPRASLIAVYDMHALDAILQSLDGYAAFTDGREAFVVVRRDLRRRTYTLNFR